MTFRYGIAILAIAISLLLSVPSNHSVVGAQLDNPKMPDSSICVPCIAGKQHRDPFPSSEHHATHSMEIVYCDLHGPFDVRT